MLYNLFQAQENFSKRNKLFIILNFNKKQQNKNRNVLNKFNFNEISVLDLFSGTGNVSYEFASRGCPNLLSIDNNHKCIKFINKTASELELNINTKKIDYKVFLKKNKKKFDIIFADPPYNAAQEIKELIDLLASGQYLKPGGVFILEHQTMAAIQHPAIIEKREYGQSTFSFFKFEDKQ